MLKRELEELSLKACLELAVQEFLKDFSSFKLEQRRELEKSQQSGKQAAELLGKVPSQQEPWQETDELLIDFQKRMEKALPQILQYFELLQEKNKYLNLTAKASAYDLAIIHFLDSLMLLKAWPGAWPKAEQSFIDLGTGAGLPGLLYKLIFPELRVVLVDSLRKRLRFIAELKEQLDLKELELVHARFEDLAHQPEYRGQFTVVTARAVAALPTLLEYAAAFIKPEGYFLAMKGKQAEAELKDAKKAIKELNLRFIENLNFKLPLENAERSILLFCPQSKLAKKYPRKASEIKRKPLV